MRIVQVTLELNNLRNFVYLKTFCRLLRCLKEIPDHKFRVHEQNYMNRNSRFHVIVPKYNRSQDHPERQEYVRSLTGTLDFLLQHTELARICQEARICQ
jgi:hypothetical protein